MGSKQSVPPPAGLPNETGVRVMFLRVVPFAFRGEGFTRYAFTVRFADFEWVIVRRFSEVMSLHNSVAAHARITAKVVFPLMDSMPEKRWGAGRFDPGFLNRRAAQLEAYLNALVGIRWVWQVGATREFFEVSPQSFARVYGRKGKEGWVRKRSGGHRSIMNSRLWDSWDNRWMVLKDNCIAYFDTPNSPHPSGVMMVDDWFKVLAAPGGTKIKIANRSRELVLNCQTTRHMLEWSNAINEFFQVHPRKSQLPNSSFAPPRTDTNAAWFVDGRSTYAAMARAILDAKKEVFITGWWLDPFIPLVREGPEDKWLTLLDLVRLKAAQKVHVYVLIYKEIAAALTKNKSQHAKNALVAVNPQYVHVLRHPNHLSLNPTESSVFWSHHEKLLVLDQKIGFVGGIDICKGRYDWHDHHLTDPERAVWPDKDFHNSRIKSDENVVGGSSGGGGGGFLSRIRNLASSSSTPTAAAASQPPTPASPGTDTRTGTGFGGAAGADATTGEGDSPAPQQPHASACPPPAAVSSTPAAVAGTTSAAAAAAAGGASSTAGPSSNSAMAVPPPEVATATAVPPPMGAATPPTGSAGGAAAGAGGSSTPSTTAPPDKDTVNRDLHPRMPWHDIHAVVTGAAALDLAFHFIQRWNHHRIVKGEPKQPVLIPRTDQAPWWTGGPDDPEDPPPLWARELVTATAVPPPPTPSSAGYPSAGYPPVARPPYAQYPSASAGAPPYPGYPSVGPPSSSAAYPTYPSVGPPSSSSSSAAPAAAPAAAYPVRPAVPSSSSSTSTPMYPSTSMYPSSSNAPARAVPPPHMYPSMYPSTSSAATALPPPPSSDLAHPVPPPPAPPTAAAAAFPSSSSSSSSPAPPALTRATTRPIFPVITNPAPVLAKYDAIVNRVCPMSYRRLAAPYTGDTCDVSTAGPGALNDPDIGTAMGCQAQILRSVAEWSIGLPPECSIANAYCHLIRSAESFIYIENQFFISGNAGQGIQNKVVEAILDRIGVAIRSRQTFRVVIVLPVHPEGDPHRDASVQAVLHYQYLTISRGPGSIFQRMRVMYPGIDPYEYISFYSLRQSGFLGDQPTTEQVYVHSKLMIVDDRAVIIGSANINDRSMKANTDSEVCVLLFGGQQIPISMDGKVFMANEFAHSLRLRLWQEHTGRMHLEVPELVDPVRKDVYFDQFMRTALRNTAYYEAFFPSVSHFTGIGDQAREQRARLMVATPGEAQQQQQQQQQAAGEGSAAPGTPTMGGGVDGSLPPATAAVVEPPLTVTEATGTLVLFSFGFLVDQDLRPSAFTKEAYIDAKMFQ